MLEVERAIKEEQKSIEGKILVLNKAKKEQMGIEDKLNRARVSVKRSVKGVDRGSAGYRDINLRYGRSRMQNIVKEVMGALKDAPAEMALMRDYMGQENMPTD